MSELTQRRLKEILHYNPETGIFTWRVRMSTRALVGSEAGCTEEHGYRVIRIAGKGYRAHRLAWLYVTGMWPNLEIDHKDTDHANNSWVNLREATGSQNQANTHAQCNNKVGLKGVRKCRKRFRATIRANGTQFHLGTFDTPEDAHEAYARAAQELFGDFARVA